MLLRILLRTRVLEHYQGVLCVRHGAFSDTVVSEVLGRHSRSVSDAVHPTWSSAHRCRLEERGGE